jgi:hypothetical protein
VWFSSPIILNTGEPASPPPGQSIDVALTLAMADLKAEFLHADTGAVRYGDIAGSEPFARYEAMTNGLRSFDLRSLRERGTRLAFWINIYNTAVIHGVVRLGLTRSVKEVPGFFQRIEYEIGGYHFPLHEMEHGILRGNRRPPYGLMRPFREGDPRLQFFVQSPDPRIHFALVCGARSCPPVGFYEAEQIDFQLELAAASFVNSAQVEILPEERTVRLSRIFQWYKSDFGGSDRALADTILRFLDDGEKKEFLRGNRDTVRIQYRPYDWSLNG